MAQNTEAAVSGGVSRLQGAFLGTSGGTRVTLDDGFRLGFRLTLNPGLWTGHEIGYAYSRTSFLLDPQQAGSFGTSIHTGSYAYLLYAAKEGSRVRPFAAGGAHFNNYVFPGVSSLSGGGRSKIGVNYGAGVKFRIREAWLLRLDARQYITGKPNFGFQGASGAIRQNEISIGFGIGL